MRSSAGGNGKNFWVLVTVVCLALSVLGCRVKKAETESVPWSIKWSKVSYGPMQTNEFDYEQCQVVGKGMGIDIKETACSAVDRIRRRTEKDVRNTGYLATEGEILEELLITYGSNVLPWVEGQKSEIWPREYLLTEKVYDVLNRTNVVDWVDWAILGSMDYDRSRRAVSRLVFWSVLHMQERRRPWRVGSHNAVPAKDLSENRAVQKVLAYYVAWANEYSKPEYRRDWRCDGVRDTVLELLEYGATNGLSREAIELGQPRIVRE